MAILGVELTGPHQNRFLAYQGDSLGVRMTVGCLCCLLGLLEIGDFELLGLSFSEGLAWFGW